MACNTIINIPNTDCGNNIGGIYQIYGISQDSITGTTIDEATHMVTDIQTDGTLFQKFYVDRNIANLTSTPVPNFDGGNTTYDTTLSAVFKRRQAATSRALTVLGEGQRYLGFLVQTANEDWNYIPYSRLNGGPETTNVQQKDGSNYTVEFMAELNNRPYFVPLSAVTAVIS